MLDVSAKILNVLKCIVVAIEKAKNVKKIHVTVKVVKIQQMVYCKKEEKNNKNNLNKKEIKTQEVTIILAIKKNKLLM